MPRLRFIGFSKRPTRSRLACSLSLPLTKLPATMPPLSKSIIVISGLGNAVGTGAAVARLFSSQLGYRIALLSRPRKDVDDLKKDINAAGGVVSPCSSSGGEEGS